ncbi:MAG: site-specific DNA-methyltransferase, partial [bacterium]|nr:site-specific DNA-methyltransferase [bacterium]
VHRNKGIDAIIPGQFSTGPLTVRVQRDEETLEDAAFALFKASQKKKSSKMILIKTNNSEPLFKQPIPPDIVIIDSIALEIKELVGLIETTKSMIAL